ncbi:hypothetical protein [Pantoea piersonii]|nr:hypothetical protein [Pantoea piersonii]WBV23534.1 hypothetical protein PG877_09135 [Pantoea piersonii]
MSARPFFTDAAVDRGWVDNPAQAAGPVVGSAAVAASDRESGRDR